MLRKQLELDAHFPQTGEATVQIAAFPGRSGGLVIEKRAFAEARSPLYDFLQTVQPEAGATFLLVNALGAWEAYDDNKNGDGFPEKPYKKGVRATCGHPDCTKTLDGWIAEHEVLTKHYPSFEEHGGIYKHHCFPSGTTVVCGDRTRRPIESIEVGDVVETSVGPRAVTAVFRTPYRGAGVRLRLRGQLEALCGTADHPVWVLRRDQVHCPHGYNRLSDSPHRDNCTRYREPVGVPAWVPLSEVLPGDYLLLRPPAPGAEAVEPAFAALVGWVASEGYLGARGIIQFTFSSSNQADITSVSSCLAELGHHVTVTPRPQYGTTMLTACSTVLHARLSRYVQGTYADKHLTGAVLDWNREALLRLLGAYIDGDGHVCPDGKNHGQLRIRSSSPSMLAALADVVRALGAPVTTNWDVSAGTMVSPTNGAVYPTNGSGCVAITPDHVPALVRYSRKQTTRKVDDVTRAWAYEGFHLVQVAERDDVELDEEVFNLEVAGPHTFVANEVMVHNCNKDKSKSLGDIKKAVWNTRMRRVELLLKVYNSRAGDLIERVGSDDLPAVSMGTHVKWDVCTICGHRAPTRAQYCQHAMAHLREILPDGRKVSVLNPSPRFFDISFVFRPADPTGWTLQKVARAYAVPSALAGEALDAHEAVRARFAKTAEEIHAAWHAPASYIGAFARLVDPATGGGAAWPQAEVYKFAADAFGLTLDDATTARLVSMTPGLVALLGDYPETFKAASAEMKNVLRQQVYEPRDELPTFGLGPGARYRTAEPPRTDILTMTDPYTGHVYQTTRGAAMAASTQDARKRLLNTALFGGLYAAGLHAGLGGALGAWSLPAGLALGAATDHFVQRAPHPYRNPTYMTDQGVPVSGGTEFKQASLTPAAWAAKLASDGAVARATGGRFGAWTSLPPGIQADQLAFGADRPGDTAYDPPSVDLNRLASNVAFILGL